MDAWLLWVKTHNNDFASFLRTVGTPSLSNDTSYSLSVSGFYVRMMPGWTIRYNRNLICDDDETIELKIGEVDTVDVL
jgi:hypothetical protein